jgi:hypothetical protein
VLDLLDSARRTILVDSRLLAKTAPCRSALECQLSLHSARSHTTPPSNHNATYPLIGIKKFNQKSLYDKANCKLAVVRLAKSESSRLPLK